MNKMKTKLEEIYVGQKNRMKANLKSNGIAAMRKLQD